MDPKTAIYITIGVFTAIIGVYIFLFKHIGNGKHPDSSKVVYKDVFESEVGRIDDCIEGSINNLNRRIDELRVDVKDGFADVKELIKNGRKS